MREHDPPKAGEGHLRAGKQYQMRDVMHQIAVAEKAMLGSQKSTTRIADICAGARVNEARARRLIRSVRQLWHYRAQAFGTPGKARTLILPMAQEVYERAMLRRPPKLPCRRDGCGAEAGEECEHRGLGPPDLGAAISALKLQAEICGLSKETVKELSAPDETRVPENLAQETEKVANQVIDKMLAFGSNGHGGNGKGNGSRGLA